MQAIRVFQKAPDIGSLRLSLQQLTSPQPTPDKLVVEVRSAGVNPSDVKATLGLMPHAVWPRTPGRDYAGIVVDGPREWLGREVWGSGGELGIRRDGTHASHLVVDTAAAREKPAAVSLLDAGAVGVPFVTAYEGLRRAGLPQEGDTVVVFGANGKVGQATIQLATQGGARVFGVERQREAYIGHATGDVHMIDASSEDVAGVIMEATGGHGADIAYNTVGSPYFDVANRALALRGRHIFIATIERTVPFDILAFYRAQQTFVGIDTLALDSLDCAWILDALKPGFESGALKPFPVREAQVLPLERAVEGYQAVLSGARDRVVVRP
jgi:NADPH:quinone reductase-like Zn-dependent oxidoreductase